MTILKAEKASLNKCWFLYLLRSFCELRLSGFHDSIDFSSALCWLLEARANFSLSNALKLTRFKKKRKRNEKKISVPKRGKYEMDKKHSCLNSQQARQRE